jgi:hypothetical protein
MITGDIYDGEWLNGRKNGYGNYIFSNGDAYDGHFVAGVR